MVLKFFTGTPDCKHQCPMMDLAAQHAAGTPALVVEAKIAEELRCGLQRLAQQHMHAAQLVTDARTCCW